MDDRHAADRFVQAFAAFSHVIFAFGLFLLGVNLADALYSVGVFAAALDDRASFVFDAHRAFQRNSRWI